jgi:hypothetical protein
MIAGSFTSFNGIAIGRIIRLNSNGSRDATFNSSVGVVNNIVYAVAQQTDGRQYLQGVLQYNTTL